MRLTNRTPFGRIAIARRQTMLTLAAAERAMKNRCVGGDSHVTRVHLLNRDVDLSNVRYSNLTETPIVIGEKMRIVCYDCGHENVVNTKTLEPTAFVHRTIYLCPSCHQI